MEKWWWSQTRWVEELAKEEKMRLAVAKSLKKFGRMRELNMFDVDGKDTD